jgi:hypothetical protein
VSRIRAWLHRRDVFAVWFDDVFAGVRTADDIPLIFRLHEHISRAGTLCVVNDLSDRPALASPQAGVVAWVKNAARRVVLLALVLRLVGFRG